MKPAAAAPAVTREPELAVLLRLAGVRYWTASMLPALVGATLPFWLRPPRFAFRRPAALEFLAAVLLCHAGFSLLLARDRGHATTAWTRRRLLGTSAAGLAAACLLGLHLNAGLTLHRGVPGGIFVVYGVLTLFTGALYAAPPLSFWRRAGGETVVCVGLGLLPVLGAYLVQVGDITRKVYLAAAPLVAATAIWVWTDELAARRDDATAGRWTTAHLRGPRFSTRAVPAALAGILGATIVLGVAAGPLAPGALAALLPAGLAWPIVRRCGRDAGDPASARTAGRLAALLHLGTGVIVAASSLAAARR